MKPEANILPPKNTQSSNIKSKQAPLIPEFIEWISDGLMVFDSQMNFTYVNQKGGEILGQRPEELAGKNYWKEYPEAKDTDFAKVCQQALKTQSQGVFEAYYKPVERWIQHRLYPSKDGLAICYTDITEHKKVETALQESEEKYRHLVETAHDLIWAVDEKGRITFINEAAKEIYGYRPKELIGRSYLDFLSPEERARQEHFSSQRIGHDDNVVFEQEIEIVHRNGTRRILLANAVRIFDEVGNSLGSMGTSADITERRKAEDALRENTEFLANLLENSPVAIYITGNDNRIRLVNRQWEIDTGISRTKAIEHSLDQVFPADIADKLKRDNQKVIETGASIEFEDKLNASQYLTVKFPLRDASGQIASAGGISVNITDRKQAKDALQRTEALFRTVLHSAPLTIFATDKEGTFTISEGKGLERVGLKPGQHVGTSALDVYGSIQLVGEAGEKLAGKDVIRRALSGESLTTYTEMSGAFYENLVGPLRDKDGNVAGIVGVSIDITERVQAEDEKNRQAARAETLVRTAARLNRQLELEAVIPAVCQEALETFGVSQCAIALYDEENDWLAYAGGVNVPPEEVEGMEPIPRAQFEEIMRVMGPLIIVPNVQEVPGLPNAERNVRQDIRTVVVATMSREKELIGTLTLGVKGRERSFAPDELTLLKALSDQAAQAIVNAKLLKTANEQRTQLRMLSAKLAEAQEAERHTLTNELHDRVGQNLTALSINLQNMKGLLASQVPEVIASKFDDAQELVQETTRHIRDIMAELHPPELEDYGLAAALETYAERAASRGNLKLQADLPDLSPPLPVKLRIVLFRAAQEAISNVLKHASASRMKVSLRERNGRIRIRVEDNGRGFEPDLTPRKEAQTWGLKIMQERIESTGGIFQIDSKPGKGTRVTFEAPRPPS